MAKLKTNVLYRDPETGRTLLGRTGEDVPKKLVPNPAVFEDDDSGDEAARIEPDPPIEDGLGNRSVPELREIADSRDVDLTGASRKDEIIERLRAAE